MNGVVSGFAKEDKRYEIFAMLCKRGCFSLYRIISTVSSFVGRKVRQRSPPFIILIKIVN